MDMLKLALIAGGAYLGYKLVSSAGAAPAPSAAPVPPSTGCVTGVEVPLPTGYATPTAAFNAFCSAHDSWASGGSSVSGLWCNSQRCNQSYRYNANSPSYIKIEPYADQMPMGYGFSGCR